MAGVIFALYCFRFFSLGSYLREKGFIQRGNQLIQKNIVNKEGTKEWHMEFLDSGRKCWTLDSGLWTLDPVPWTLDDTLWTLGSGYWTPSSAVSEQNQKSVSDSVWLNYWTFFGGKSLRTSWSRLFCRDYRFWCSYFQKFYITVKCYDIKECRKKSLWEIELHYKQLSWTIQKQPSTAINFRKFLGGRVLLLVKLQTDCSE